MTFTSINHRAIPHNIRILLLEDYQLDAELVCHHLSRSEPSWQVDHVNSKEGFLAYLKKQSPDVIISDYALTSFSGLDAYLVIKGLGIEIPFIMLTGQLPEGSAKQFVESGIDDYVLKSSLARLDHVVKRALERHQAELERRTIAEELSLSEKRYKSIFDKAGVALAEFMYDARLHDFDGAHASPKVQKQFIVDVLSSLKVTAVNQAALTLFEVSDAETFKRCISEFFGLSSMRLIIRNALQLSEGEQSAEQLIEATTLKGHNRILLVKTVLDPSRKSFVTVSFTDLTSVRESEIRVMRIVERLEDTVAARVQELSALNEKLENEASERERINEALRENYFQMTESIIAAKRIQQLLLPRMSDLSAAFSDIFVYARPKGIVSGDFYWFHQDGPRRWMACVDCTGHGVPGAFMSMLSSKLLNQAVIEQELTTPSDVLASIDTYVVRELRQREVGNLVSTGMDISLCLFDDSTGELSFSGAYQGLIIKEDEHIELIRGDRRSLGGTFQHATSGYTLHRRKIKPGQCCYLLTDGILDQFGGPSNKKFTRRRFLQLIEELGQESMYEQELLIKNRLQDWKGTNEQIDDILVMGIRL